HEHGLNRRLWDAFVGIRGKREHVERRQPRCDVVLVPNQAHAVPQAERGDLVLQRLALRALTDDKELRIAMRQHRYRIDEIAMSLPAAQRRADADQRGRLWQTQPAARLLLVARRE